MKHLRKRDRLARVGWTALQAALGVITVEALDVPTEYAVLVAAALSYVKGLVAERVNPVGDSSTLR